MKAISIGLTENELMITEFSNKKLSRYRSSNYGQDFEVVDLLLKLSQQNRSWFTSCCLSLQPDQYETYILENINVPDKELMDAIKCQLQAKTKVNVDDLLLDYIAIPSSKNKKDTKYITFAAEQNTVYRLIDLADQAGLKVNKIIPADISAINILQNYIDDNKLSNDLVVFYYDCLSAKKIIVHKDGRVHLLRNIKTYKAKSGSYSLTHEIKRSINYIISSYGYSSNINLVLAKSASGYDDILNNIEQDSDIKILTLDFNNSVNGFDFSYKEQQKLLLTAGAVY